MRKLESQNGAPTMAEIARRCRLSKATVSRALSLPAERCLVKPRTREQIIRVAKKLGYRPNWRARAFSRQKTHTVGLIITGLLPQHEAIPHQILEAFTSILRVSGYHLALVPVDGAFDWRDLVFGGHVDGCATINDEPDEVVAELSRSRMPAVAMNTSARTPLPVVTVDDFQGGQEVGRYLRSLGHQRVAMYVNDAAKPHYSQEDRLRGVTAGLNGAGNGRASVQFVRDGHERAMFRLLDQRPLPTAIVCYSHYEALPILKEAWERKIKIPEHLSVITFNDVFPLDSTIPSVTRICVPAEKIGIHAARLLLAQMQKGEQAEPSVQVFPETLVLRESCAPPPPPPPPSSE
jgi:LacI family transcriptional regulator, galactose operon repressor